MMRSSPLSNFLELGVIRDPIRVLEPDARCTQGQEMLSSLGRGHAASSLCETHLVPSYSAQQAALAVHNHMTIPGSTLHLLHFRRGSICTSYMLI